MKFLQIFFEVTILTGLILIILPGCTVKQASVAPEGLLSVLGPFPGFSTLDLPDDWIIKKSGSLDLGQLLVVTKDGTPSLRVTNAEDSFVIVRRTNAMMLATPFLSWSWLIKPPSTSGYHPVRMVIGFYGGASKNRHVSSQPLRWPGSSLPTHDRIISLTWGESALQRGTIETPSKDNTIATPRYTVRGGRENTGSWWLETVDLSDLYRKIWPQDNMAVAQVVFIGIEAVAGHVSAPVHVSGITLSR
jgi:hypothetical protein